MADTLKLEIVTPQGTAFSEDVEMVTVPGADGQFGVYPHHLRLIAQVEPGELIVIQNGQERSLAVGEGFAEVTDTKVSILTDMAIAAEKIDEQLRAWGLTESEKEVALLLLKGLGHSEVAQIRGTSQKTSRQQAAAVYQKAGLSGRAELSAYFLEDLLLLHDPMKKSAGLGNRLDGNQ